MQTVYNGHDVLALMPTGGGKSITFQVPALAKEGICLVISPLIALMKDQVENLKSRGIRAAAIHSGLTKHEIQIMLENCCNGGYKFLYLSPERVSTTLFLDWLPRLNVNLIAIDESHCISQWGYDFRPSYIKLADLRDKLPEVPVLAVTATATPEVVEDIMDKLRFKNRKVLKMSFERKNLTYLVRQVDDKQKYLLKIVKSLPGSAVVYVRNRRNTQEIATILQKAGEKADYYHAGLSTEMRNAKQDDWIKDRTRIIVATNAFGMGIDKPNVRFVVHMDLPDSPEAYFQEAGRGGRDGKLSYAILLYNKTDDSKAAKRIDTAFPLPEEIRSTYNALGSYLQIPIGAGKGEIFDFNLMDFATAYKLNASKAYSSLKFLEMEGYLELTDELDNPSRLIFLVSRQDLYKYQVANAEMDKFIKVILRSYPGPFNNYVVIDEKFLTKASGLSHDKVYENLKKLSKQRIINYIPRKKTPLIIFNDERTDAKGLWISKENYTDRKNRYLSRAEAMLQYAQSTTKCRSQALLEYFGEQNAYRCGKCDVCTSRNELDMSKYEFDLILEQIKAAISSLPLELEPLVDSVKAQPEKTLKVIKWLNDNGKITTNNEGMIEWREGT